MSHCPSCGRYAGPYEACPYCGARLAGRMPVRVVKVVAILLSTVGLVALWFAATRAEVPLIQIGQVDATDYGVMYGIVGGIVLLGVSVGSAVWWEGI